MTRVDFAFNATDRIDQAALSTLRHVARGARVFVYCDEPARLDQFSQRLWSLNDTAFVPHERLDQNTDTEHLAVLLVDQANWPLLVTRVKPEDWLLNLDDQCPPEVTLFTRVLEVVSSVDHDKQLARARWRQYQTMGLVLEAHQLKHQP